MPDELSEVLGALTVIVGAVVAVIGIAFRSGQRAKGLDVEIATLAKRIDEEVRDLLQKIDERQQAKGERIGRVEDGLSNLTGKVEALTDDKVAFGLEVSTNTREIGRLDGEQKGMEAALRALAAEVAEMNALIRERIATLEERTALGRPRKPPEN